MAVDSRSPRGFEHDGDVFAQCVHVVAGAVHEGDEVVRVSEDPPAALDTGRKVPARYIGDGTDTVGSAG